MVAVPNTNVYLVVLDGGDCPDSAIKCTSVSNSSFCCMKWIQKENMHKKISAATMATKRAKVNLAHDAERGKMTCKGTMNLHVHNCAEFLTTELKVEPIWDEDQNSLISCSNTEHVPLISSCARGEGGGDRGIVVLPALLYVPVACVIFLCPACANIAVNIRRELFVQHDPPCSPKLKRFKGSLLGQRFV